MWSSKLNLLVVVTRGRLSKVHVQCSHLGIWPH